jgi:serine/threonine protein kinase/Tol biopolymer transport system component
MTPERYRQIGEIYYAALEVKAEERAAFLAQACVGDDALQREVESLIASHEEGSGFIETPALKFAARVLAGSEADVLIGKVVGRYKILSLIGAGGMGRVYLAEDSQLGRQAALKFLPEYFTHDKERVQRFRQEARSAAALNHPNIAHIYEIGEAEGTYFIAMEYVEGVTLREKIHHERTRLPRLLKYLQQVADALAKAHAAGIVHRDLKPDNIMVTKDGHTKVLDFGLAKLTEQQKPQNADAEDTSEAATAIMSAQLLSTPGVIMGTVGYMSPEQAQGKKVDPRSDIFSFGCILFEAAARHKPFAGQDVLDSLHNIVHAPTPQIKDLNPVAPDELQRIVRRCLAKDPDKRYQSIKEVAIEIEELGEELKHAREHYATHQSTNGEATTSASPEQQSTTSQAISSSKQITAPPISSSEILISEIKRHKAGVVLIASLAVVLIAAAVFGIYKLIGPRMPTSGPAQMKISRLTAGGKVGNADILGATTISPDGRYVVFATADAGKQALWVRQVSTNSLVQISAPAEATYEGTTFSPDGELVYFTRLDEQNRLGALYQVPVLGGTPRKVLGGVTSPISFSPDGKRFAYVSFAPQKGESYLMVANADGSGEQTLATRKEPQLFSAYGCSWSPDGKMIAINVATNGGTNPAQLVGVPVSDGAERILMSEKFDFIARTLWLGNGSGLVFSANQKFSSPGTQIFLVSYPSGQARRITNDLNSYGLESIGLTADGNTIVTTQRDVSAQISVVDAGKDTSQAARVSNGKYDGMSGLAWTPENRIVYVTRTGESIDIWSMLSDGTDAKQLTADGQDKMMPAVSPEGRYIVFAATLSGRTNIWRIEMDGTNLKPLMSGSVPGFFPTISADGAWVIFNSPASGKLVLWKVGIDGGEPQQLTNDVSLFPAVSPDNKWLACFFPDETAGGKSKIAIMPLAGGAVTKIFDISPGFNSDKDLTLIWARDGTALTYVDQLNGADNIWSQPISGEPRKPLTNFKQDRIFNFAWSRDGKRLAVAHGTVTTDVVLIKDFR